MEPDLVSSIFRHLKLKTSAQVVFDAAGSWTITVPVHHGIKIHTILRGCCWISLAEDPTPRKLVEGDCYLLPRGNAFTMASEPSISGKDLGPEMVLRRNEGLTLVNGGGEYLASGLFFGFEGDFADILFSSLPPLTVVPAAASQASDLEANTRRFAAEFRGSQIGRSLVLQQLAPVILMDLLRISFAERPGPSWFAAALEPELSRVLSLMHHDYGHRWSLDELAVTVGMSRSKLAARFKTAVGIAPMEYLCRWRMEIARDLLKNERKSLAEVSQHVGYDSESAFSSAFLRVTKSRPGSVQKRRS